MLTAKILIFDFFQGRVWLLEFLQSWRISKVDPSPKDRSHWRRVRHQVHLQQQQPHCGIGILGLDCYNCPVFKPLLRSQTKNSQIIHKLDNCVWFLNGSTNHVSFYHFKSKLEKVWILILNFSEIVKSINVVPRSWGL